MDPRLAHARDRWDGLPASSQLLRFIQGACSPENFEPNLALCLEIADLINSKKGSMPRVAAFAIVGFINHRNQTVALLALHLLDICVKNCGYPFYLQISTKEFLNELVRRFPDKPPIRPTRVQSKILEAIAEWRSTICDTSRYKEDLGFIRDMHRLLCYKGYAFPETRREDLAVLHPSDALRSAEEMEEEEREAQSAKLHELIRRGSPDALREANYLMKVMAGYDTRSKTDYHAKAAEEIIKIQAKAHILEERLETFQPGDQLPDGDVFAELATSLRSAQTKLQKMCEDESDDHDAVSKLLEVNDSIHRTIKRYELLKKGDVQEARLISSGKSHVKSSEYSAELSLIDFDTEAGGNGALANHTPLADKGSLLEDDLLGLSIDQSDRLDQGGGIALGFGANTNVPGPALLSSTTHNSTAAIPFFVSSPPAYSAFSSASSSAISPTGTPHPAHLKSSGLASPASRSQFKSPTPADPFAVLGSLMSSHPDPANGAQSSTANDDDEWSFSSALPPDTSPIPAQRHITVSETSLKIECLANRPPGNGFIRLSFEFSNNSAESITELHFHVGVPKGYVTQLRPQSGRDLRPGESRGVIQDVEVWNSTDRTRRVESLKLRWRVAYRLGSQQQNEAGDVAEFQIA